MQVHIFETNIKMPMKHDFTPTPTMRDFTDSELEALPENRQPPMTAIDRIMAYAISATNAVMGFDRKILSHEKYCN